MKRTRLGDVAGRRGGVPLLLGLARRRRRPESRPALRVVDGGISDRGRDRFYRENFVDLTDAAPGEFITLRLAPSCHGESPGFSAVAADHVVPVAFVPPAGPRNVAVLTTDCRAIEAARRTCEARTDVATATCFEVNGEGLPRPSGRAEPADVHALHGGARRRGGWCRPRSRLSLPTQPLVHRLAARDVDRRQPARGRDPAQGAAAPGPPPAPLQLGAQAVGQEAAQRPALFGGPHLRLDQHASISLQSQAGRPDTVQRGAGMSLRWRQVWAVCALTPSRSAICAAPTGKELDRAIERERSV